LEKSENITWMATTSQLNKRQTWLAYSYYYMPPMTYCLTAVNMSEQELLIIQQKATTQCTRMIGFECTFLKPVVHAPISFGGLGFLNLYTESNIMKIEAIICHINKITPLAGKMKTILNWYKRIQEWKFQSCKTGIISIMYRIIGTKKLKHFWTAATHN
jgi:hypothetical protein